MTCNLRHPTSLDHPVARWAKIWLLKPVGIECRMSSAKEQCCSVLQCGAMCCSVLQCVAVCCSVLQCVAVCCSVLQCVAECLVERKMSYAKRVMLLCVAVCCSMLQSVAECSIQRKMSYIKEPRAPRLQNTPRIAQIDWELDARNISQSSIVSEIVNFKMVESCLN